MLEQAIHNHNTPLSVSGACALLEDLVGAPGVLAVAGEISGLVCSRAGHSYFTLKDTSAALRCVLFAGVARRSGVQLAEGDQVTLHARASIYAKNGGLQLVAERIQTTQTQGALYAQFLKLKEQLGQEGLFNDAQKKSLPEYPSTIGVITSATGAVRRDIETTLARRFPCADLVLFAATVQGDDAAASLCRALDRAEQYVPALSCVIIGRGGGSLEDLAAFNNETLIRRIHAFNVPIVSAVGHQTDVTLCDFVADLRAATPTAAAELVSPSKDELFLWLDEQQKNIKRLLKNHMNTQAHVCDAVFARLLNARTLLMKQSHVLETHMRVLAQSMNSALQSRHTQLALTEQKILARNPQALFKRGFVYASTEGKPVKSIAQLTHKQALKLQLQDGVVDTEVQAIHSAMKEPVTH